jgi:hypothetical protein
LLAGLSQLPHGHFRRPLWSRREYKYCFIDANGSPLRRMHRSMSSNVVNQIKCRYPAGGAELKIALAIGEQANDVGESIDLRTATLTEATGLSVHKIQFTLRRMVRDGWILLVHDVAGEPRRYVIDPKWIEGRAHLPSQLVLTAELL